MIEAQSIPWEKHMTKLAIGAALLGALATATVASAQTKPAKPAAVAEVPAMAAGLWEVTLVEQAPNSTNKRTITARTCLSGEDVKLLERVLPQQRDVGMKCQHREVKAQGAVVSWKIACTGKDSTTSGVAQLTLASESYSGQAKLERKTGGKSSKVDQDIAGKRVGDCP
jgi:Protein of unknown function (DUF3617)